MKILPTWALAGLFGALLAGCGDLGCGEPQKRQAGQAGCDGYVTLNTGSNSAMQPYQCVKQCPAGHVVGPVEVDEQTGKPWTEARGVCLKQ